MGIIQQISTKKWAPLVSVTSNTVLTLAKIIVGLLTGSVAILSEAVHSATDLLASLMAFVSVRWAAKPADERRQFGYGKIENISGTIEGLIIFSAAGFIIYEAIRKILDIDNYELVSLEWGLAVMGTAAVVNYLVSRHLRRVGKKTDSVAIEADGWHLLTDVYTSAGVFVGLLVVQLTGIKILDPIIAIIMALVICRAAYKITAKAMKDLVDTRLPLHEVNRIRRVADAYIGEIVTYRDLQTRKSGGERYMHLTITTPQDMTVREAHAICDRLETEIDAEIPGIHVIIHCEPCALTDSGECPVACPVTPRHDDRGTRLPESTADLFPPADGRPHRNRRPGLTAYGQRRNQGHRTTPLK